MELSVVPARLAREKIRQLTGSGDGKVAIARVVHQAINEEVPRNHTSQERFFPGPPRLDEKTTETWHPREVMAGPRCGPKNREVP